LADRYARAAQSGDALRFSADEPWSTRISDVRHTLESFSPEVVSVQFVCYGFDCRGLAFRVGSRLKQIVGGIPVHFMLHELWIGAETGARLKHRVIGALQRQVVRRMISTLRPRVIHTSNAAYVHLLSREQITAERLPLFGNIPIVNALSAAYQPERIVIFGAIPEVWAAEALLAKLEARGSPFEIVHVGRTGAGNGVWERMTRVAPTGMQFVKMGERSPAEISELFAGASAGIATAPLTLIDKSGSVAAMLEHGLPVIVTRDDVRYSGHASSEETDPCLVKLSELPIRWPIPRRVAGSRLPAVATQFLTALERSLR
jgi:hypothetical protein